MEKDAIPQCFMMFLPKLKFIIRLPCVIWTELKISDQLQSNVKHGY